MSLTTNEMTWLGFAQQAIAFNPKFAWIKPSWVMAWIDREGGFTNPLVVNTEGRKDGPMQVIPSTVIEVAQAYGWNLMLPQTDPWTSILTGTGYVNLEARQLLGGLHMGGSLPLDDVVQTYNIGPTAFLRGSRNTTYLLNWLKSQAKFAFVDGVGAMVVV